MPKLIKRAIPCLLLTVILTLFSFSGCGSYTPSTMPWTGTAPENLTQQQWQDILKVALEYQAHLETFHLNEMTSISTDVVGGSNPWERSLNISLVGAKNLVEEQTQMDLTMSMIMEGMGQDREDQSVVYNMYAPNDWLYISMATLNMGSYWIRVKRSGELEEFFSFNAAEQQIKTLNSTTNIEYLRTEKLNDVDCYVLSITPNNNELASWLDKQDTGFQGIDWQKVTNDTNSLKDLNFTCYLAKDSYLIMRMSMIMVIELTPEQANATSADFDTTQISFSINLALSNQNAPFTITLPMDAYTANEVSSDIFLD